MAIRRIGILTGGGDCPGLNAVLRAVTKTAIYELGMEVVGIEDGFLGLIEDRMRRLLPEDVSNILTLGGTILGTSNKANPTSHPVEVDGQLVKQDVTDQCLRHLAHRGIEALVVIGGDGTMTGAANFVARGVPCIGVPKTIDNDLEGTDVTFGFATARDIATEALDRVHTTAASHHRAMIVEVMGRNAGWIALEAGSASGSDIILLPEIPYDIDALCQTVERRGQKGKRYTIVCASEGARPRGGQQVVDRIAVDSPDPVRLGGIGRVVGAAIEERTGIETRTTVLGHVQRGGTPSPEDRVLATRFGHAAGRLLAHGRVNRLVVMRGRQVTDIDILEAAGRQRLVPADHALVQAGRAVGTSFAD